MVTTLSSRITVNPGIKGGKPCIAGRRISVQDVAIWHERMGMSADEIAAEYDLSLPEVYLALAYYFDNQEAIDKSIREDQLFVEQLRKKTPSPLRQKLNALENAHQVLHG